MAFVVNAEPWGTAEEFIRVLDTDGAILELDRRVMALTNTEEFAGALSLAVIFGAVLLIAELASESIDSVESRAPANLQPGYGDGVCCDSYRDFRR